MRSLSVLYERLIRLGEQPRYARNLCVAAEAMLHCDGRFIIPAGGGYVLGYMTNHGVRLGSPRATQRRAATTERMARVEA